MKINKTEQILVYFLTLALTETKTDDPTWNEAIQIEDISSMANNHQFIWLEIGFYESLFGFLRNNFHSFVNQPLYAETVPSTHIYRWNVYTNLQLNDEEKKFMNVKKRTTGTAKILRHWKRMGSVCVHVMMVAVLQFPEHK